MIPRRDGVRGGSHCLPGWDVKRLREQLVTPSISDCDSGFDAVEGLTVSPEVLPQDSCRGRAQTPWGVTCLVWSRGSVFQWEFEQPSSDLRRGPWLDRRIPISDVGAQEWADEWVGHWVEGKKNPVRRVSVSVSGTPFQRAVWRALLEVPRGSLTSYGRLATAIGAPGAARAVGTACGANRVALLVPCHRVIRESGELSGYRWGMDRKVRLLAGELGGQEPW
jgi:AraC family transcriptional regulator of adaptative response/methylated-DNA-[protein]-cysteine methyltransferase